MNKAKELIMKLPKTLIYALACISELEKEPSNYERVREIAEAQSIPPAYCQKVLMLLAKSGYVESIKGRGVHLICSPKDVKALDLMNALGKEEKENEFQLKKIRIFEKELSKRISLKLSDTTVEDLIMNQQS
jgi:Rrf2 family protein